MVDDITQAGPTYCEDLVFARQKRSSWQDRREFNEGWSSARWVFHWSSLLLALSFASWLEKNKGKLFQSSNVPAWRERPSSGTPPSPQWEAPAFLDLKTTMGREDIEVIIAPWRRRTEPVRCWDQCGRCWGRCGRCWSPTQGVQPLHFPPEGRVDEKTSAEWSFTTCPAGWPTGSCPTAAPTLAARAEETIVAARASHFSLAASVSFGLDRFGITGFWWYLPILALAAHVLSSPRFATDWCYSIVHFDIRLPKYGFVKIISMHLSLLFNDISIKQCLFLHLWGRRKLYKSNQKISWKDFNTLSQQNLRLVWLSFWPVG